MSLQATKSRATDLETRQLVCFRIGQEDFGIDIKYVQDIHQMVRVTSVPQAPDFVAGVINLRGQIIPVIDLHQRFFNTHRNLAEADARIIVLAIDRLLIGCIVDSVTQILRLSQERIYPPPELLRALTAVQYLESLAIIDEQQVLVILNPSFILKDEERSQLEQMKRAI
jgi:purine-binding chemotaxis protein CheW